MSPAPRFSRSAAPKRPTSVRRGAPLSHRPLWSAKTLPVLAAALGASLVVSFLLQFATPIGDRFPALGGMMTGLNALLALGVLGAAATRPDAMLRYGSPAAVVLVVCLALGGLRGRHAASLAGSTAYAPPHHEIRYPDSAQELTLRADDGTLVGATYLGSGSGMGLVLIPGLSSTRHGFAIASLAQWLAPRFDVLVLDVRGQGTSGGAFGPDLAARLDVAAAVNYLVEHHAPAVGVLAEQETAPAAIAAAARNRAVRSVAIVDPLERWGDFPDPGLDTALGRTLQRVVSGLRVKGGVMETDTAALLAACKGPSLVVMGPRNDPGGRIGRLHRAVPEPRSLRLFTTNGHPVAWSEYHHYCQTVSQWFGLTLNEGDASFGASSSAAPDDTR